MSESARFSGGRNIAMKVPSHEYEAVVAFYRDVLGLEELESKRPDVCFQFGGNQLWIDKVSGISQAEIWLEVRAENEAAAKAHFAKNGVVRRDEIEPLPEGSDGFWIANPANVIHLVGSSTAA